MKKITPLLLILLFPIVTHAQSLQEFFTNLTKFLSNIVIPFLLGIAFLFFVWNAFRFFILGGANEESQDKAKSLAIYGVSAFVLIITFWGIINLLASSLGFDGCDPPKSDYASKDFVGPPDADCLD